MSIIPILTPKQLIGILLKAGFKILRQKGSHIRLEHLFTKMVTTIALHSKDLSRKMLVKILKQTGISVIKFLELIKK